MKFRATILTADGASSDEVIEAADRFAAYRMVRDRGGRAITLKEERPTRFAFLFADIFSGVSADEKVILVRNLAAMLDAGLTVSRALGVSERQTLNQRLKAVLSAVIADVKKGSALSDAMAKFPGIFPQLALSMTRSGEESGKLAESLRAVSLQMERSALLAKRIRDALIYPSIVIILMVAIGIVMLIYVVPSLTATFTQLNVPLPGTTLFLIAVSTFLVSHTLASISGIVVVVLLLFLSSRTPRGGRVTDWIFLRLPIIRDIVIETESARTARTLSSLLSAGVGMISSLVITREVVWNHYFRNVLKEAEKDVTKGSPLSATFAAHPEFYPPLMPEMVAVGEETGRLPEMLKQTAEFYEASVERRTKDLSTIIEPLLMIVIGIAVGFFTIAVLGPIYSLSSSIG